MCYRMNWVEWELERKQAQRRREEQQRAATERRAEPVPPAAAPERPKKVETEPELV